MAGLAEVTLVGILVADPELHIGSTGDAVATFTVAANDGHYDLTSGEWVDKGTIFLRCSIGCQAAENIAESLAQGIHVIVTGALRRRESQTTEGDKRYTHEVDATEVGISLKRTKVMITKITPDATSR